MEAVAAAGKRVNLAWDVVHRAVAVVSGLALTVVAIGLYVRAEWAIALWPWADVKMTYIFLASILAAAIAPSIWIGLTGELAALAPGALNTLLLNLMFAAYLGFRGLDRDEPKLLAAAAVNLAVVPFFVKALRRARATAIVDRRRMPRVVTIGLWTTCALLVVVGVPLLLQVEHVFPWDLSPQTSTMFGCTFLGAAGYFVYVARKSSWAFGAPPLLGFLAYDIVLLSAYPDRLLSPFRGDDGPTSLYGGYYGYGATTGGDGVNDRSLNVYLAVLIISALVSAYFLFIHPPTRMRLSVLKQQPFVAKLGAAVR